MICFNKPQIITYGEVEQEKIYVCSSSCFFMIFEQFVLCSQAPVNQAVCMHRLQP
jgi:hypothetical protein